MTTPRASVVHDAYGRARLRVPEMRHQAGYFSHVAVELRRLDQVREVKTSATTGSILLNYVGSLASILEAADRAALFQAEPPSVAGLVAMAQRLRRLNMRLADFSHGETDLATLAVLTLGGAAVYQIARGNWFPPAASLLGQAFNLMATMSREPS